MKKLFNFFFIVLAFEMELSAINIYVATGGSNTGSGSLQNPFQTIQFALDQATPGDMIFIMGGTYHERLLWSQSGTSGNYITLTNYNSDVVILNGYMATNDAQNAMLDISNMSYIAIENLLITENYRNDAEGIYFSGSGNNITIKGCELYNIGWSSNPQANANSSNNAHAMVFVGTEPSAIRNLLIENNNIHNCITGWSEALTLVGNVDGFQILNNRVNEITNIGIDLAGFWSWTGAPVDVNFARNGLVKGNIVSNCVSNYATSAGIYTDGAISITIENNVVFGNGMGIEVGMENNYEVYGMIVRNNIVYHNLGAGLYFGAYAKSGMVKNSTISGNVFYNNDLGFTMGDWTGEIVMQKNKDCKITNNIIYPRDAVNKKAIIMGARSTTNLLVDYNLYWRESGDMANLHDVGSGNTYSLDVHKIEANPLFVNYGLFDFHIQSSSPAINAGDPDYISSPGETDMDGDLRIFNQILDIGADEMDNGQGTIPTAPSALIANAVSPNQIDLSWNDNSTNEDNFIVERSPDGTTAWEQIALLNPNITLHSDMGLEPATDYYYRVKAINTDGSSNYSNISFATTQEQVSGNWVTLSNDDFETGWGIWNDGGADAARYTGTTNAHSGTGCLGIQDNTTTSVITTNNIDLSNATILKIDFWFYAVSMEINEDFWLQVSTDGGNNFTTIQMWSLGPDFNNKTDYSQSITLDWLDFTANTKIRFRCDASADNDDVFIDDVVISAFINQGTQTPSNAPDNLIATALSENQINLSRIDHSTFSQNQKAYLGEASHQPKADWVIFPNPVSNFVYIDNVPDNSLISIYNLLGKLILETTKQQINIEDLVEGTYLIKISDGHRTKVFEILKQ